MSKYSFPLFIVNTTYLYIFALFVTHTYLIDALNYYSNFQTLLNYNQYSLFVTYVLCLSKKHWNRLGKLKFVPKDKKMNVGKTRNLTNFSNNTILY